MPTKSGILLLTGLLALGACKVAQADWVQLDGGLNYSQASNLGAPKVGVAAQSPADDAPYAIVTEMFPVFPRNYRLYVYRWNNSDWIGVTTTGSFLNYAIDQHASEPAMDVSNNSGTHEVAVAWSEPVGAYNRVFVKRWSTGTLSWQLLSQTAPAQDWINRYAQHANNPSIALPKPDPTRPFVAWQENVSGGGRHIYAKAYNGANWDLLPNTIHPGEALNRTITASSYGSMPQIAMGTDDRPVVAWEEYVADQPNIYVSRWNGATWIPAGGGLRDGGDSIPATSPSLAVDALNRIWVAFLEGTPGAVTVKVKRFDGIAWNLVGNPVLTGVAAKVPRLALVPNQDVFLSLLDTSGPQGQVRVFVFENPNWVPLGGSLNVNPANPADVSFVAIRDGQPLVIWPEGTPNTYTPHVFVKQWIPPTPTASPTPTVGPSPTATLPATVAGLSQNTVLAYPNPAFQQVTFAFRADSGSGQAFVRLYNTHYRLVTQASGTATDGQGSITLDVSGLAQGVYFYQAVVNGKNLPMGKLVVAR
jgi:hypothetical protein